LLLNEEEYLKAARRLAANVLSKHGGAAQRVDAIYETITSQLPQDGERQAFLKLVSDLQTLYDASPELAAELCGDQQLPEHVAPSQLAAWTLVTSTILNLDITKTRQ
jgi:hypothetical protein